MDDIFVSLEPPEDFNPTLIVSLCYCEWNGKILFVKRNSDQPLGGAWGIPGGKLKAGESPRETVIREVFEELRLTIENEELEELGKVYVRHYADVILHLFRKHFLERPILNLNLEEHSDMRWLTPEEALRLPYITGGVKALQFYM